MNKLFLILLLSAVCFPLAVSAQNPATETPASDAVEAEKDYVYCLLIGRPRAFTNKISVSIDFGEERSFFQDTRLRDEQTGKVKTFNSMIDALNFMSGHGWKFVQAYVMLESNLSNTYWILRKEAGTPLLQKDKD